MPPGKPRPARAPASPAAVAQVTPKAEAAAKGTGPKAEAAAKGTGPKAEAAAKGTGPKAEAAAYLFERLRELASTTDPWWLRAHDIGLRMRLTELVQLAEDQQTGSVAREAVRNLRDEAHSVLARKGGYAEEYLPEVVHILRKPLTREDVDGFIPGGAASESLQACLQHLEETSYQAHLNESLDQACRKVDGPASYRDLDLLIELYDSELIFDGHSPAWRMRVASDAETHVADGVSLRDALDRSLSENRHGVQRTFDILVPLRVHDVPEAGGIFRTALDLDSALEVLREWGSEKVVQAAGDAVAFVSYQTEAPDPDAAAQRADERFRFEAALFRLQGGAAEDKQFCLAFDRRNRQAFVLSLPPSRLVTLPPELAVYEFDPDSSPMDRIPSALAQLAQARLGTPGAALADLWTAAEVAFGGPIGDPVHEVAGALADLAQYLFPRQMLAWLAARAEHAGLSLRPDVPRYIGMVELMDGEYPAVATALADDALARERLRWVGEWERGTKFSDAVDRIRSRAMGLTNRAYLMRNYMYHSGRRDMAALSATLPAFSSLVSGSIVHVLTQDSKTRAPLQVAKLGALRTERASRDYNQNATNAREGLMRMLS